MFHGKTLKKSLSLILAVVLLASMCAVCFGTFASAYTEKTTLKYDFDEGTGISGYTTGLGNGYVDVNGGKAFNVKSTASNGNSIEIGRPDTVTRTDGGYNADALSFLPGKTYTVSFKFRLNAGTTLLRSNESQLAIERYHSAQAAYVAGAETKKGYGNIFTKKLIEYGADYVESQNYTFEENVEKTVYTVKQNTEWEIATFDFTAPTEFGTFEVDGNPVLRDRLCLVFGAADGKYLKDVNGENIDYKLDMLIDDMEITGIFDMSTKGARAYTFNWRNSEGTQAYTNSHDKISLTSHKTGNKGIADVMQESSGLTEDGMIIGGLTDIGLKAPGEAIPEWWYHKATVYGATSLGGATDGRVKLEANTAYTVSVKYIPLSINPDVSGVFAIGRVNSSGHAAYFGDGARTDYAPETAAYTQTANTEVAHKDTYTSVQVGNTGKTYKDYADAYIAKNGWQTLTYSFKLGANYNQDEYLAIFAAASKNTLSNDTGYLTQFLVDSVTVVVSNPTDTVVTFVDGSDIVSAASANANSAVVAPAAPANTDKNFLYWKTKDNKMYQPGETITGVTSDMTVTAVYKETINFINDRTGDSALKTVGHGVFSNSDSKNEYKSYLLPDSGTMKSVKTPTGGLHLKGTEHYPHEVGKCDFKHHVYLYDPDSSFVTTAGYLQIQENMLYSITVNYKACANNSKIGISVSHEDAVGNQRMTPLAISEVSSVDVEKKLSCVIDGDASITVSCGASEPDKAVSKTLALAGKYVTITAGTPGTEVDIFSVEVSAYVKPADETFVTAYTDNNMTIYSAKPSTLLLPAANNAKGEASLGWFDATTNEAVTTVVGTAPVTVYAKYPTVTFDFEDDAAYEFNPNNKESVEHSVVASPNGSGKALKLTATRANGFTGLIGISALRGCTDAGYNFVAGQTYTVSYKAYMNSNDSNVGDGNNKNNRPAVYRAGVNGIGNSGYKDELLTANGASNFSDTEDAKLKYDQWIDMTYDVTFTEEQDPDHNYLIIGVHAPNPADNTKPNAVLYIDDLTITQNGTDLYKTTVVDTKSSLREQTEDKSAGLRFRGQLDETVVFNESVSEIGFISIPKLALDRDLAGNDWYKLDEINITADKGKVGKYAAYVKINDFKTDAGYYARAKNGDYQYQLCITGLETDAKKAADFATVMFVKNSDGFRYYYVNTISYNAVKQAYEANGIKGY